MPAEDRHRATRRKMRRSSSRLAITDSHGGMQLERILGQRRDSFRIAIIWSLTVSVCCSCVTRMIGASGAVMAMTKTDYSSHEINWFLENAVTRSSLLEGYLNPTTSVSTPRKNSLIVLRYTLETFSSSPLYQQEYDVGRGTIKAGSQRPGGLTNVQREMVH